VRRSQAASRANRDLATVKRDVLIPRASVNGRPACERCGIYADTLDASHRLPQSASSVRNKDRHRPSALMLLCRTCHGDAHAHPTIAYAAGWFVRRGEDPAAVPVRYRGRLRLLDDHGGVRPA
jgi:5-methylcytosine-specific restriction endonuclease McrA